jgi:hypothetical protein
MFSTFMPYPYLCNHEELSWLTRTSKLSSAQNATANFCLDTTGALLYKT